MFPDIKAKCKVEKCTAPVGEYEVRTVAMEEAVTPTRMRSGLSGGCSKGPGGLWGLVVDAHDSWVGTVCWWRSLWCW